MISSLTPFRFPQPKCPVCAKIPLEACRTLLPDECTDMVNVYQVSLRKIGAWDKNYARGYGILRQHLHSPSQTAPCEASRYLTG